MKISKIALYCLLTTLFCFASETSRNVSMGGSGGGGGGDKIANNFNRGVEDLKPSKPNFGDGSGGGKLGGEGSGGFKI